MRHPTAFWRASLGNANTTQQLRCGDPSRRGSSELLPIRDNLVSHYLRAARQLKLEEALVTKASELDAYAQLREEIGFGLHAKEKELLLQRLQNN